MLTWLKVVLSLRADGATVPETVSKWADEENWMGGDAVVLSADTAEVCIMLHNVSVSLSCICRYCIDFVATLTLLARLTS